MPTSVVVPEIGPFQNTPEIKTENVVLQPNEDEVVVQVLAAGLAFPDILQIEGKHIEKRKTPFIIGREVSGIVTKVGNGVTNVAVGDRVFGAAYKGGVTTEAVLPAAQVYKFGSNMSPYAASGFELNYGTTYHALVDVANVQKGEILVVLGASGGVGLSAIDIGKALGATVIACASTEEKLNVCKKAGADHVINYSDPKKMRKEIEVITGGKVTMGGGVDVIYDPVGGDWTENAVRCLKWRGRLLVIGFASGGSNPTSAIPKLPLNLALLNERQVLGVLWGYWKIGHPDENRKNVNTMVQWVEEKRLKPYISKVYPMYEFKQALLDMMNRKVIGKVAIDTTKTGSKV